MRRQTMGEEKLDSRIPEHQLIHMSDERAMH
jgi:hypothetical protein